MADHDLKGLTNASSAPIPRSEKAGGPLEGGGNATLKAAMGIGGGNAAVPAMPVTVGEQCYDHRNKINCASLVGMALVARILNKREIADNPAAQAALKT